jgi:hypothetical protein
VRADTVTSSLRPGVREVPPFLLALGALTGTADNFARIRDSRFDGRDVRFADMVKTSMLVCAPSHFVRLRRGCEDNLFGS